MEAWICPEADVEAAQEQNLECMQVQHKGELVWACSVDPDTTSPPESWQSPASWKAESDDPEETLFNRLKEALPTLDLSKLFSL